MLAQGVPVAYDGQSRVGITCQSQKTWQVYLQVFAEDGQAPHASGRES